MAIPTFVPIFVVDAFAEGPFTGNPAAVCLLENAGPADWMQRVASEMRHSETAFLHPVEGGWSLRWFTPSVEVELCGHATLASAHALWESGRLGPDAEARFETKSGVLTACRTSSGIELDFPATPADPADPPPALLAALGVEAVGAGRTRFDWLLELADEAAVHDAAPDFSALVGADVRGVMITAAADEGRDYDFVSRFFAPGAGIDEDPVTGSAHCALAPFWCARFDRDRLVGAQLSSRGGRVGVCLDGERVRLSGRAVTTLRGELLVAPHLT